MESSKAGPIKSHFWGIVLIVVLLIASTVTVRVWKARHPGSMTVIESQAMDMTVMKPPTGSVPVATEIVHTRGFSAKVTYTGSVAPLQEQIIYPRVEGSLKNLSVYNGSNVARGQVLAVIDSPDLQSKVAEAAAGHAAAITEVPTARYSVDAAVAEASAAQGEIAASQSETERSKTMVTSAKRAATQAEKEVASAKAKVEYWRAEIAREADLLKNGAVSLNDYQSEKSEAASAEADLENKQAGLEAARANVKGAEAEVNTRQAAIKVARDRLSAAKAALAGARSQVNQKAAAARQAGAASLTASIVDSYRYLRAPFAGVVTKRYMSPGQFVTPSTAVLDVVQIDFVRLQANVSDRDLAAIRVGTPVTAHFANGSKLALNAVVTSISPLSDVSSRTAVVEAIVPNPGHRLMPGDAVTLDISTSSSSDALSVPASAIVQRNGASAVWVVRREAAKGKTMYTCTMHPQIIRDKPGDCPICFMPLVPMNATGAKRAHLVSVVTGASDGERVEIRSGLKDGEEVIYRGNTYLREGDSLSVSKWDENGPVELPSAPGGGQTSAPASGKPSGGGSMPGMEMK